LSTKSLNCCPKYSCNRNSCQSANSETAGWPTERASGL